MPPTKHAAKHAKKHTPEQGNAKDLRRAYEHLGRVEAMQSLAGAAPSSVQRLQLAKSYLDGGLAKQGADLLRAAEHFSFAALPSHSKPNARINATLLNSVEDEWHKLASKAEHHWAEHDDRSPILTQMFETAFAEAKAAFEEKKYRQALELARGAEALAHVHGDPSEAPQRRLTGANPVALSALPLGDLA